MKYIITDQNEVAVGINTYHQIIKDELKLKGRVIAAGHCEFVKETGKYRVYGESVGYGIQSKPEDADVLNSAKEVGIYQPNYAMA